MPFEDWTGQTYAVVVSVSSMPLVRCVQSRGRDGVVAVAAAAVEVLHRPDLLVGSRRGASSVASEAICQGTALVIEGAAEAVTAAEGGLIPNLVRGRQREEGVTAEVQVALVLGNGPRTTDDGLDVFLISE